MNDEQIKAMVLEYVPEYLLAGIVEVTTERFIAYIAQLNRPLCLGTPIVVVDSGGTLGYANKDDAFAIVGIAQEKALLDPRLYV